MSLSASAITAVLSIAGFGVAAWTAINAHAAQKRQNELAQRAVEQSEFNSYKADAQRKETEAQKQIEHLKARLKAQQVALQSLQVWGNQVVAVMQAKGIPPPRIPDAAGLWWSNPDEGDGE